VVIVSDTPKLAFKKALLSRIGYCLIRIVASTLRVRLEGWEPYIHHDSKLIFCGWHGKSFIFANHFRKRGYWVIISHSNDGDIQNTIFQKLGFQSIRGSSGRGGVRAALQGVKILREGGTMAITPDGPRGPSGEVQGGVMLMAQKSGAGLVPIGISCRPAIHFKSWDRYMLPIMFGRARLVFGEPIYVASHATESEVEEARLSLQNEINRLEQVASR
jgi:lysophospholipid acyltransferase (LPLAT)-like uncharacterized protein